MRGRPRKLENLSVTELQQKLDEIVRAKEAKRREEASKLKAAITAMVKAEGFKVQDIIR